MRRSGKERVGSSRCLRRTDASVLTTESKNTVFRKKTILYTRLRFNFKRFILFLANLCNVWKCSCGK